MGYRNYFAVIEKEEADKILNLSHEEQMKLTSEYIREEWEGSGEEDEQVAKYLENNEVDSYALRKHLKPEEVIECGKYFDYDVAQKVKEDCRDYSDEDTEFCIVKPEALLVAADYYRNNTVKYYEAVIRSFDMTDEECLEDKDMGYRRPNLTASFRHQIYDLKKLKIDKENILKHKVLMDTWQYEYDMFNLLHLYKNIDWDKYYLIWLGY